MEGRPVHYMRMQQQILPYVATSRLMWALEADLVTCWPCQGFLHTAVYSLQAGYMYAWPLKCCNLGSDACLT